MGVLTSTSAAGAFGDVVAAVSLDETCSATGALRLNAIKPCPCGPPPVPPLPIVRVSMSHNRSPQMSIETPEAVTRRNAISSQVGKFKRGIANDPSVAGDRYAADRSTAKLSR